MGSRRLTGLGRSWNMEGDAGAGSHRVKETRERRYALMTPQEFIAIWQKANLSERSACQQHFLNLCELLGQPKLVAADPEGAWYTFERGVTKTDGGNGWLAASSAERADPECADLP